MNKWYWRVLEAALQFFRWRLIFHGRTKWKDWEVQLFKRGEWYDDQNWVEKMWAEKKAARLAKELRRTK